MSQKVVPSTCRVSVCLHSLSWFIANVISDISDMEQELPIYRHHALYIPRLPYDRFCPLLHFGCFYIVEGKEWGHESHGKWVYSHHLHTATFPTKEREIDSSHLYLPRSDLEVQHIVLLCNKPALKYLWLRAMDLSNEKLHCEFNFQQ